MSLSSVLLLLPCLVAAGLLLLLLLTNTFLKVLAVITNVPGQIVGTAVMGSVNAVVNRKASFLQVYALHGL